MKEINGKSEKIEKCLNFNLKLIENLEKIINKLISAENHCITDFENTAAFSRDYQSAQDCMCDNEHMLDCSNETEREDERANMKMSSSDLDQIVERFQVIKNVIKGIPLRICITPKYLHYRHFF